MSKIYRFGRFDAVSLFAGSGIIPFALEHSAFRNLGIIKSRECKIETISKNKPDWAIMPYDFDSQIPINFVTSYLGFEKNDLDLFSTLIYLNPKFVENHPINWKFLTNKYMESFLYYLEEFMPKTFLINFDKHTGAEKFVIKNLKSIKIFMQRLEKIGYTLHLKEFNSYYFSVSQKSQYLMIVGIRNDLDKLAKFEFPQEKIKPVYLKSIIRQCPESQGAKYPTWKQDVFDYIKQGENWEALPEDVFNKYKDNFPKEEPLNKNFLKRLSTEEVCPFIYILPQQSRTDYCHPFENRPLNIRETARCKSIPDTWEFVGYSRDQYKQIAKAVPYRLIVAVSIKIREFLVTITYKVPKNN